MFAGAVSPTALFLVFVILFSTTPHLYMFLGYYSAQTFGTQDVDNFPGLSLQDDFSRRAIWEKCTSVYIFFWITQRQTSKQAKLDDFSGVASKRITTYIYHLSHYNTPLYAFSEHPSIQFSEQKKKSIFFACCLSKRYTAFLPYLCDAPFGSNMPLQKLFDALCLILSKPK
jgi:hypothetical protein